MVKKLLTLACGLLLSIGAMAQYSNPVVPQDSIRFWTGSGSNRAVIAITWNDATAGNIGLAWGVQWNGSNVTLADLMDTIDAYDANLTIEHGANTFSIINNLSYANAELGLNLVGPAGWWWYNWTAADGSTKQSYGAAADIVVSGDFVDWLPMDENTYESYPADTMIMAVAPVVPEEATIAASDILYWVGTGANEVVMAVNWADTALAWGYRFDGEKTVSDMMDDIAEADPRFSYTMDGGYLGDILFVVAEGDTLRKQAYSYWESKQNGVSDAGMGQALANGAFEKWAEPAAGVVVDSFSYEWEGTTYWSYIYVYPMEISPVSDPNPAPQPEEATIAASDIVYWVGTGAKEVVMAVNWADTALAWGYRFDGEKTVSDMMDDIAEADPRFSYTMDGGYLGDILFVVAEGDTLRKQAYSYWESKQNGVSDAGMGQALANGAFEKWAEPAAGVVVDSFSYEWEGATYWSYIYVYPMEISPVSVPQTTGIDGVEGATVSVYPNPVADVLTVSGVNGRAVLFDMRGSVVASFDVDGAETRVSLGSLANGVYMLRVADGVAKIVVRH